MNTFPLPPFSPAFSKCFSLIFFLCLVFLASCAPRPEDTQFRTSLLEAQKKQSEELSRIVRLAEDNAAQYENLLPLFQGLLKNDKEQQKAILQIRNLLAEYEKAEKQSQNPEKPKPPPSANDTQKTIVGGVEAVRIVPPDVVLLARVDTGAQTSSLDARNITPFERDGDPWVRFDIPAPKGDQMISMEQKLSRRVRILQASADESERRVVVELSITIGGITQLAEFTLTDREHLTYPMLVGRNILKDIMVVDVSRPRPSVP